MKIRRFLLPETPPDTGTRLQVLRQAQSLCSQAKVLSPIPQLQARGTRFPHAPQARSIRTDKLKFQSAACPEAHDGAAHGCRSRRSSSVDQKTTPPASPLARCLDCLTSFAESRGASSRWSSRPVMATTLPTTTAARFWKRSRSKSSPRATRQVFEHHDSEGFVVLLGEFFSTEVSEPPMVTVLLSSCSVSLAMGMNLLLSSTAGSRRADDR